MREKEKEKELKRESKRERETVSSLPRKQALAK